MSNTPIPRRNIAYGYPNPNTALFPEPIRNAIAPTIYDFQEIGTEWVDTTTGALYFLTSISDGQAHWQLVTTSGGPGDFSSLTVNPGPTILDGALSVNAGNNPVYIETTDNAALAISLTTNGGTSETIVITNTQGTAAGAITLDAVAGGILVESAHASATAINIEATNAAGGIAITADTGGIAIDSGTGTIGISTNASASIVEVGTGAAEKAVILGSTNTSSETTINAGTGGISLNTGTTNPTAGFISMAPQTGTVASGGSDTVTVNSRVILATYTGYTTADSGGIQELYVASSEITTTSACHVTVTTLNASGHDAFMTITGIIQAAGMLTISLANNGAGALGTGDNILITVWVLS